MDNNENATFIKRYDDRMIDEIERMFPNTYHRFMRVNIRSNAYLRRVSAIEKECKKYIGAHISSIPYVEIKLKQVERHAAHVNVDADKLVEDCEMLGGYLNKEYTERKTSPDRKHRDYFQKMINDICPDKNGAKKRMKDALDNVIQDFHQTEKNAYHKQYNANHNNSYTKRNKSITERHRPERRTAAYKKSMAVHDTNANNNYRKMPSWQRQEEFWGNRLNARDRRKTHRKAPITSRASSSN